MTDIDENLVVPLNTICTNLMTILNSTDKLLLTEKEKYKQVLSITKPWPIKKRKSTEHIQNLQCTCSTNIEKSCEKTDTSTLSFDDIPKIVNKTKALRINPSKNNITKYVDTKKRIKDVISIYGKPPSSTNLKSNSKTTIKSTQEAKTVVSKSCTSLSKNASSTIVSSGVNRSLSHDPSCAFYNLNQNLEKRRSFNNLSEAITAYGVPSSLNKTLKDYYKFVLETETDNITLKARHSFLKHLDKQNEENWNKATKTVTKLPKYMSALSTIENKLVKSNMLPCIIYRNIEDLIKFEKYKSSLHEKELWNKILKYINIQFVPVLYGIHLNEREKIYICKMLKAICNFTESRIPNVPFFRIN